MKPAYLRDISKRPQTVSVCQLFWYLLDPDNPVPADEGNVQLEYPPDSYVASLYEQSELS
jgi:hypothetical protein